MFPMSARGAQWFALALGTGLSAATLLASQQPAQFRARVELVRFDVTVLDRSRQPVRGLTLADFTVLEDGKPQQLALVSEVNVPPPPEVPAAWMLEAPLDVQTNSLENRRLLVIVLDDAANQSRPGDLAHTKAAALKVVDRLGPNDLAAIVSTADNRLPEDFTTDRTRLRAAIDRAGPAWGGSVHPLFAQYSVNVLGRLADFLADLPDRRKAIVYVSSGVKYEPVVGPGYKPRPLDVDQRDLQAGVMRLLANAERSNVSIFAVSPAAVEGLALDDEHREQSDRIEYLRLVSEKTGGFALIAGNLDAGISRIFSETGSYYVLGYTPLNPSRDGTYRRVQVTVNRPGVTVISRNGYDADDADKVARSGKPPESPLLKALGGVLPNPDLPMKVSVAAFADAGPQAPERAALSVVLAAKQAAPSERLTKNIDLQVSVFDPEGRSRGWKRQTAKVVLRPSASSEAEFEVVARVPVMKPGQYSVRVAAHDVTDNRSGSVYMTVDVPDFFKAPVSLSGVLLSVTPGHVSAPQDALAGLAPVTPTTVRDFTRADRVTAFTRVYQGKDAKGPHSVSLTVRVLDDRDTAVVSVQETMPAARFAGGRASDARLDVPVARLAPGQYLLTMVAALPDARSAKRDVRFSVR